MSDCWSRLAVDVTHYGSQLYLSLVDCGPSRFSVWKDIRSEDAQVVAAALKQVFMDLGSPVELLLDNRATFRSNHVKRVCDKWSVSLRFRCAYRPSGNGIVERMLRTIKRIAARSRISPIEAVFWYNLAPRTRDADSAPSTMLFSSGYKWRNPNLAMLKADPPADAPFQIGDVVFEKLVNVRCNSQWPIGRVTAVLSEQSVAVNGILRHVTDCRLVEPRETDAMCRKDGGYEDEDSASDSEEDRQPHATSSEEVSSDSEDGCSDVEQQQVVPDRPRRNRQTPIALCFQNIQWAFVTSSSALDTFYLLMYTSRGMC